MRLAASLAYGTWAENYGAGGVRDGANVPIRAPGGAITFTYDHHTHVISDDAPRPLQAVRGPHWLRSGVIAWRPRDRDDDRRPPRP